MSSSKASTKKKSKKSKRNINTHQLSNSSLNLSPVVETHSDDDDYYNQYHHEEYNSGIDSAPYDYSGGNVSSNNRGYDINGIELRNSEQQQSRIEYNRRHFDADMQQQQLDASANYSLEDGAVDTSFDSESGVVAGGEVSNIRRTYSDDQQQNNIQRGRKRHTKSNSVDYSSHPPFMPTEDEDDEDLHTTHYSTTIKSNNRGGGYNIANDITVASPNSNNYNSKYSSGYTNLSPGNNTILSTTSISPGNMPNFEEADLLQRAIERRAVLHNRIVAMEAAKAELERDTISDAGSVSSRGSRSSREYDSPRKHNRRDSGSESGSSLNSSPQLSPIYSRRVESTSRGVHNRHPSDEMRYGEIHTRRKEKKSPKHRGKKTELARERYHTSTSMRHPPSSCYDVPISVSSSVRQQTSARAGGSNDRETTREEYNRSPFDEEEKDRFVNIIQDELSSSNSPMYSSSQPTGTQPKQKKMSRKRMGEHHARMNELSERIKKEAIEFMNYESSFTEEKQRLMNDESYNTIVGEEKSRQVVPIQQQQQVVIDDDMMRNANFMDSFIDENEIELDDIEEENEEDSYGSSTASASNRESNTRPLHSSSSSHRSSTRGESSSVIDSSAWGDGQPTSQQLSRYSNMVRLGIPDVAVLRSMERDGISNSQEILTKLKESHNSSTSSSDRQDIHRRTNSRDSSSSSRSRKIEDAVPSSSNTDNERDDRQQLPLCEDPNYSKYFKMLKAKVPLSWVRRVLEVDGKDARVLDLNPDEPLSTQVPNGAVDEFGNVDWDNVNVKKQRTDSEASVDEGMKSSTDDNTVGNIPSDTFASVKAELAAMSAKAAGESLLRTVPSDEEARTTSNSTSQPSGSDLTSAAIAASNERMDRLKRLSASSKKKEVGRRRQTTDEIRRRGGFTKPSTATSKSSTRSSTIPKSSTLQATTSTEQVDSSDKTKETDLPLKDDPRFSKYFQMIRSRVPRSWVERVIEVDDRDPAILDLDPNKSLASQIGEDHVDEMVGGKDEEESDTLGSTYSETLTPSVSVVDKGEEGKQLDESGGETPESSGLPVTQVDENDENKSEASSITANFAKETQEEKSSIDLNRISAFLDKMEAQINDRDDVGAAAAFDTAKLPRFTTTEEVENKLAELIDNFGKQKEANKARQEESMTSEKEQLVEKSQADINRLSNLLAKKVDQPSTEEQAVPDNEQSNIEALPKLLTQVLEKMDKRDEQPFIEPNKVDLDARRELVKAELEAQPKALAEDPEYEKYFKMLKLGLPRSAVLQALERDGKDASILDLDPNTPLKDQRNKLDEPVVPDKNAALKDLFAKRAAKLKENDKPNKTEALEALFAKRSAEMQPEGQIAPPLRTDPNYSKYFKMLKVGMPRETVMQALERDGKDTSVVDMDPEQSYASQIKMNEEKEVEKDVSAEPLLKDEYAKFFKMLKMGIPAGAVRQALQKEGKDPDIVDMDPEKSYASQVKKDEVKEEKDSAAEEPALKDDPDYTKFFKMLKMGIPAGAVQNALKKEGKDTSIIDMDPEKSYASQVKGKDDVKEDSDPPLRDDPQFSKYFKMLKMGLPLGAVQNSMTKDGKDPTIMTLDHDKSLSSQLKGKDSGPPLKDDPDYSKYFKMLKMGLPMGAVQNAMQKDGKDTSIITLDPEKSLSSQQSPSKAKDAKKQPAKPKGPKVARKRLHWNKIDESKLSENSFWNQAKDESLQLVGLDFDNEEFASLFTSEVGKKPVTPKKEETKKTSSKQKVQLIDGRRRMNGSILLSKFKVDYKVLARQVDNMEYIKAEGNELRGMMQLLPTKDESLALRSYLPPPDAPQSEIEESIAKLGECEQYMAVMLDVPDAKEKFESMIFRAEFESHTDSIRDGTKVLLQACDAVKNSERFKKLLLYALKLGNAMNTGGNNEAVSAITLDSLLKLAEAKAFDRQTSVLHYLVSIVQKNDADVLKLSEDFGPVKAAEYVAMDMLASELKNMEKGIDSLKNVVLKHLPEDLPAPSEDTPEEYELRRANNFEGSNVDQLLATPMGKFSLSASSKIKSLSNEFGKGKTNFAGLLEFFGEDTSMTPEAFFCTINTFVSMFDQTHKELVRKEEAKARKKRIEEKRKLREDGVTPGKKNEIEPPKPNPRQALMAAITDKASTTSNLTETKAEGTEESKTDDKKVSEAAEPNPRQALISMLNKRAPPVASTDEPKSGSKEEATASNPRDLMSMLSKRAPPTTPTEGEPKAEYQKKPSTDGSDSRVTEVEERLQNELNQLVMDIWRIGDPNQPSCSFGELFVDEQVEQFYEGIAATLWSAKKRNIVAYDSQVLMQGMHDKVIIYLVNDTASEASDILVPTLVKEEQDNNEESIPSSDESDKKEEVAPQDQKEEATEPEQPNPRQALMAMLNKRVSEDVDEPDSQEDNSEDYGEKEDGPKEDATQNNLEEPESDPREALMAMLNKRITPDATEGEDDEEFFEAAEETPPDDPQDKQEDANEEQKDEDEPLEPPPKEGGCNQS